YFFKNDDWKQFQQKCTRFSLEKLPQIVKTSALECIQKHQEAGDRVMIVTASAENWLSAWCEKMKLELIATRLEIKNDKLTGKIEGTNCFGLEKVRRLTQKVDLKSFDKIYVYADSKGDKELLDVADYPFYKSFK
ncbi:MAG: HAD-IB family phosphatase, partial [Bacteroidota bacterium]|nr:HAD-IB family phosphatase [Bacteroidota bacterium]